MLDFLEVIKGLMPNGLFQNACRGFHWGTSPWGLFPRDFAFQILMKTLLRNWQDLCCKGGDSSMGGGTATTNKAAQATVKRAKRSREAITDKIADAYGKYLRTGQRGDLVKAQLLARDNDIKLSKIKNAVFGGAEYQKMIYSGYSKYLNKAETREISELDINYRLSNDPEDSRILLAALVRKNIYKKYVFESIAKTPAFKSLIREKARNVK